MSLFHMLFYNFLLIEKLEWKTFKKNQPIKNIKLSMSSLAFTIMFYWYGMGKILIYIMWYLENEFISFQQLKLHKENMVADALAQTTFNLCFWDASIFKYFGKIWNLFDDWWILG